MINVCKSGTDSWLTGWQRFGWPEWAGLLLSIVAFAFFYCSVLKIDYLKTSLIDLPPDSDASEYYAMARSMKCGGPPKIRIGHELLPSRYPPGYSVLMLPWLKILPEKQQILAPFRTSQSMGLLLLCSVWIFYWRRGEPLGAGLTTLLLATLPGFVNYCRAPMSEMSGITLICLAFMAAFLGLNQQRRGWVYLCALFLGLAVNIRMQLVFFGPILLTMAWIGEQDKRLPWLLHCSGILLFFAFCASPIFIINTIQFGHPLRTGYDFWVPDIVALGAAFSGRNIWPGALSLLRELFQLSDTFTVANLFGTGTHFTPAYIALALIGCLFLRSWKFIFCAGLPWVCYLAGTMMFYYNDGRMYLPFIVLLAPLATLPALLADQALSRKKYILPIMAALFLLAITGYPSQSGYPKKAWRSQWTDALSLAPHDQPRKAVNFMAAHELLALAENRPGIVLSTINPVFLNAILPVGFSAAPLDSQHLFQHSHIWKYGTKEAKELAQKGIADKRPVYALFASNQETSIEIQRLPKIPNYYWAPLSAANDRSFIFSLTTKRAESTIDPGKH